MTILIGRSRRLCAERFWVSHRICRRRGTGDRSSTGDRGAMGYCVGGRLLQFALADATTDEICQQLSKPFEPWLEPFCLAETRKISQFDDKFRIAGDGVFKTVIVLLIFRCIIPQPCIVIRKEFFVESLPFICRGGITGVVIADRWSSLSFVRSIEVNE